MRGFIPDLWNEFAAEVILHSRSTVRKDSARDIGQSSPTDSNLFAHSVGSYRGQDDDFRSSIPGSERSIHVVEYGAGYAAHIDQVDPHKKPAEHVFLEFVLPKIVRSMVLGGILWYLTRRKAC